MEPSETPRRFDGRVALVTGASRGIGAGIAQRLAVEGADLALVARTADATDSSGHPLPGSLAETAATCEGHGVRVLTLPADLSDADQRSILVERTIAELGRIDIVVNNAAVDINQPIAELSLKRRQLMVEVNVHAPVDLATAALADMSTRGEGWVLNVSSGSKRHPEGPPFDLSGQKGIFGHYAASKAMLDRVSTAMAAEWHQFGVRVNTVEPRGAVLSEGARAALTVELPPEKIESIEAMVEASVHLCQVGPDHTARNEVSLDLLARLGLPTRSLDATLLDTDDPEGS